jgi:hypothetical protein
MPATVQTSAATKATPIQNGLLAVILHAPFVFECAATAVKEKSEPLLPSDSK